MGKPVAFLIIRFSSIGDIVLTTPIIRSLKKAHPEAEIHFLTKKAFAPILGPNPYLHQVWELDNNWSTLVQRLRKIPFAHILDLHTNLRSWRMRLALRRPSSGFSKENWTKWWMTHGKKPIPTLDHIVHRYGKTLEAAGAQLDEEGLDFFIPQSALDTANEIWEKDQLPPSPLVVVLGATYSTKRWIPAHFAKSLNQIGQPVVLLGGPDARKEATEITAALTIPYYDQVGKVSLMTSVALMHFCQTVITHDTGLMHIAAALGKRIISLWGNTVPEFGMTPYKVPHTVLEVKNLDCRPCSKIGYDTCPKGHFRCMRDLKPERLVRAVQEQS